MGDFLLTWLLIAFTAVGLVLIVIAGLASTLFRCEPGKGMLWTFVVWFCGIPLALFVINHITEYRYRSDRIAAERTFAKLCATEAKSEIRRSIRDVEAIRVTATYPPVGGYDGQFFFGSSVALALMGTESGRYGEYRKVFPNNEGVETPFHVDVRGLGYLPVEESLRFKINGATIEIWNLQTNELLARKTDFSLSIQPDSSATNCGGEKFGAAVVGFIRETLRPPPGVEIRTYPITHAVYKSRTVSASVLTTRLLEPGRLQSFVAPELRHRGNTLVHLSEARDTKFVLDFGFEHGLTAAILDGNAVVAVVALNTYRDGSPDLIAVRLLPSGIIEEAGSVRWPESAAWRGKKGPASGTALHVQRDKYVLTVVDTHHSAGEPWVEYTIEIPRAGLKVPAAERVLRQGPS